MTDHKKFGNFGYLMTLLWTRNLFLPGKSSAFVVHLILVELRFLSHFLFVEFLGCISFIVRKLDNFKEVLNFTHFFSIFYRINKRKRTKKVSVSFGIKGCLQKVSHKFCIFNLLPQLSFDVSNFTHTNCF